MYLASMLLSGVITIILYRAYVSLSISLLELSMIILCLLVIYVNEKTAVLEDMISKHARRAIGVAVIIILILLAWRAGIVHLIRSILPI